MVAPEPRFETTSVMTLNQARKAMGLPPVPATWRSRLARLLRHLACRIDGPRTIKIPGSTADQDALSRAIADSMIRTIKHYGQAD